MQLTEENINKVALQIKVERMRGGEYPPEERLREMAKCRIISNNILYETQKEFEKKKGLL